MGPRFREDDDEIVDTRPSKLARDPDHQVASTRKTTFQGSRRTDRNIEYLADSAFSHPLQCAPAVPTIVCDSRRHHQPVLPEYASGQVTLHCVGLDADTELLI